MPGGGRRSWRQRSEILNIRCSDSETENGSTESSAFDLGTETFSFDAAVADDGAIGSGNLERVGQVILLFDFDDTTLAAAFGGSDSSGAGASFDMLTVSNADFELALEVENELLGGKNLGFHIELSAGRSGQRSRGFDRHGTVATGRAGVALTLGCWRGSRRGWCLRSASPSLSELIGREL